MDADGLSINVTRGRGDNAETSDERVCSPFEVLGATRDGAGREWRKCLRRRDADDRDHFRHISDSALQGELSAVCAMLAGEGLRIDRAHQKSLVTYLCGVQPEGRVTIVSRTGWHNIAGQNVFVLPSQVIGPHGAENVILESAAVGPYEACGTLADWQNGVGALSADHALAVLSISAALAGPLLHLAGQEGGGLNFYGPSSQGKTTILQAGASVWAGAARRAISGHGAQRRMASKARRQAHRIPACRWMNWVSSSLRRGGGGLRALERLGQGAGGARRFPKGAEKLARPFALDRRNSHRHEAGGG